MNAQGCRNSIKAADQWPARNRVSRDTDAASIEVNDLIYEADVFLLPDAFYSLE